MYLKGWKFGVFVGSMVGLIGLAVYPIIIYPYFHIDELWFSSLQLKYLGDEKKKFTGFYK